MSVLTRKKSRVWSWLQCYFLKKSCYNGFRKGVTNFVKGVIFDAAKGAVEVEDIKKEMMDYWTRRVEKFAALRERELNGAKRRLWLAEFAGVLPRRPLDVLDIGTGTGFFAFLLAPLGHRVTGIDLTAEMIAAARRVADELGTPARFEVMDAEAPEFPRRSFDAIVTRNLTWQLPHLGAAYKKWHEILRPGGLLINFDADYCRERAGTPLPKNHAHCGITAWQMLAYEHLKDELRPTQRPRPGWDAELLAAAGFREVSLDFGAWWRLYAEHDEFYNPTPVFRITATA